MIDSMDPTEIREIIGSKEIWVIMDSTDPAEIQELIGLNMVLVTIELIDSKRAERAGEVILLRVHGPSSQPSPQWS